MSMKKIYRGDDTDIVRYWITTMKEIDTEHQFEDASEVLCQRVEPEKRSKKSLREILNEQRRGTTTMKMESLCTYDLTVEFVSEDPSVPTKSRRYSGAIQPYETIHQFILLDHDRYFTAHPIQSIINFSLFITADGIGGRELPTIMKAATEGDAASLEKQLLSYRAKEAAVDKHVAAIVRGAVSSVDHMAEEGDKKKKETLPAEDPIFDDLPSIGGKKKHKKKKRQGDMEDDEDWGTSALNVGAIRKAEHDWDFEEGSAATDDEGDVGAEDEEEKTRADVDQFIGQEVSDSSDREGEEELDATGQQIKDAMDQAELRAADAELEQFSDDDEGEDGAPKTTPDGTGAPAGNTAHINAPAKPFHPLKARIIGSLQRKGNSMLTKEFMTKFVRTKDTKDPQFVAIHKCIRELCEVIKKKDATTGAVSNYIQLKPEFRN